MCNFSALPQPGRAPARKPSRPVAAHRSPPQNTSISKPTRTISAKTEHYDEWNDDVDNDVNNDDRQAAVANEFDDIFDLALNVDSAIDAELEELGDFDSAPVEPVQKVIFIIIIILVGHSLFERHMVVGNIIGI